MHRCSRPGVGHGPATGGAGPDRLPVRFHKCPGRLVVMAAVFLAGACAGPPPRLMPVTALRSEPDPRGGCLRWFDVDGDGRAEYAERLDATGRIDGIAWDRDADASPEDQVDLRAIPAAGTRHLILILDSIAHQTAMEAWRQGRMSLFPRPSRTIAPFPVMTDPCLTEFYGIGPCLAVESGYYDGRVLRNGYEVYARNEITSWQRFTDYAMAPPGHVPTYLWPRPWLDHEFRRIQEGFTARPVDGYTGYCVGTSATGAILGRDGHRHALIRLDRFCRRVVHDARGRVCITLLSDHGHFLGESRRIALTDALRGFGYRVTDRLSRPGDVVVPEFGMVSCAAIHTASPEPVARDAVGIDGVELAAYRNNEGGVTVVGRDGSAAITRSPAGGLCYLPRDGDPLGLQAVLERLKAAGRAAADGAVDERTWFEATADHEYPDAVCRVWHAFHGLVVHTPDVLLSLEDGRHWGSATQNRLVRLIGVHGSLRAAGSSGFAVTMAGELPPVMRLAGLGEALRAAGVVMRGPAAATDAPVTWR